MKLTASVLIGLAIGWLLTLAGDVMPDAYTKWVGMMVAGSKMVVSGLQLLPFSAETLQMTHAWIIVLATQLVPIVSLSLIATYTYRWSGKARPLFYGPLAFPCYLGVVTMYANSVIAQHDAVFAGTFRALAVQHIQTYILSYVVFILLFAMLIKTTARNAIDPPTQNEL